MKKIIVFLIVSLFLILGLSLYFNNQKENTNLNKNVLYTITFISDESEFVKQDVKKNNLVLKPNNPIKKGYQFIGWYLNDDLYDFNKIVTKDFILIAKWKKIPEIKNCIISFNANGGSSINSQTIICGTKAIIPTPPTRDGYNFSGWQLSNKLYDFDSVVSTNIILNATWTIKKNVWKTAVLIIQEVNTSTFKVTMTQSDKNAIVNAINSYTSFVNSCVSNLDLQTTVTYVTEPVTHISGYGETYGPRIEKSDINDILNNYNIKNVDSIIAVANFENLRNIIEYAGLTWSDQLYSFVPYVPSWWSNNTDAPFIHEWIHQVEWWYSSLNYNVPDLHDNNTYGFTSAGNNEWKDWYRAYLSDKLVGGPSTGINSSWWKYTPSNH